MIGEDGREPAPPDPAYQQVLRGVPTVAEARAELGLGRGAGIVKNNPHHDERGRFATEGGAVKPSAHANVKPDRGVQVAENSGHGSTRTDAGSTDISPASSASDTPPRNRQTQVSDSGLTIVRETPSDAKSLQSDDHTTFLAPPTANFEDVFQAGRQFGLTGAGANVGHSGKYDFQRADGKFYPAYTNASNYGVGVYMAGAGYSRLETIVIANTYAYTMSSNAGSSAQVAWWLRGWNDATNRTGTFATSSDGNR